MFQMAAGPPIDSVALCLSCSKSHPGSIKARTQGCYAECLPLPGDWERRLGSRPVPPLPWPRSPRLRSPRLASALRLRDALQYSCMP